ncbi:cytokine receptor-like factor 2 isoform X1 [Bos javanicus]|uniref:cytokine receptor-like factor 2 isoform X1 n=1 Tax=Bos javanicus TaxID=9906 RepID=UPI002AA8A7D6|nr:cytokine receptor-like factor 2 isoform X1 [Bos javanicus]
MSRSPLGGVDLRLDASTSTMRHVFLPWAAAAVLLLGRVNASGKTKLGSALQLQVINFNFETVQVTWNSSAYAGINFTFIYKFHTKEEYRPCPDYILQHGYRAGCLLEVHRDGPLYFSIRNGTEPLLTKDLAISTYLKPRSPGALSFQWREEAVTVTCSSLGYNDLQYEIQHKTVFDAEWQSTEAETCNVTIDGLDTEKCYFFRARVKALEFAYGSETYASDWSEVTYQQRGELRDSCWENSLFPKFILIAGMVSFLTVFLLLLSLWKLHRIKKVLMPSVPDPKFSFLGLFESHQGNFQEWIKDTQNVAPLNKMEDGELECAPEDAVVVQPAEAEMPKTVLMTSPLYSQTGEEEATGDFSQLPRQPPQGRGVVSLGDFTFVMSDHSYMML